MGHSSLSNSLLEQEASQDILRMVERTNSFSQNGENLRPQDLPKIETESQDSMPHQSFIKKNRSKLKELANTYNPGASGAARYVFHKNDSNSCDGESSQNVKEKVKKAAAVPKGRLFNFLSQSKFTS
jgi:hypothetical protein